MSGSIYNTIRPTYYADTVNGSGVALSALVNPVTGQPVVPGVACYVADGDGSGNPVVWTCAVSTAAVDHSTVEAVAGATGCRWLKSGAFGGGGGGGGGGFSSDVVIQQPNSNNVQVNTLELKNQYTSNTAGSETATWVETVPIGGAQVPIVLSAVNGRARQTVSTVGATDSVAVNPRADLVVVTLGVDASSLTFTGLDLDTDAVYEVTGDPLIGTGVANSTKLRLNGDVAGCVVAWQYTQTGGATNGVNSADFIFCDGADAASVNVCGAVIHGAPSQNKKVTSEMMVTQSAARFIEKTVGRSGATANVTSLVLISTTSPTTSMKAGSVIMFRRVRGVAL